MKEEKRNGTWRPPENKQEEKDEFGVEKNRLLESYLYEGNAPIDKDDH